MSAVAAIAVGITSKNNNKAIVDDSRDGEMSTQTASTAAAPTSGAGVTSGTAVPIAGDLSARTSPSTHQPTSSTVPHHSLEQHCRLLEEENQQLKETETRLQQQYADSQRRERLLMRRLANKEQELQEYVAQIAEYKNAQAPGPAALRSAMLDPAVNILFEKLKNELQSTRAKLEETQNELSAWKFTPDSNTGKRLMAKCRLLYQENEELGKMTSNGRLAKLEGELAMQKSFNEEVKKSQSELDDFIQELDEDVEGMQSTILFLQQELKAAKDKIVQLEKDNCQVKKMDCDDDDDEVDSGRHLVNGTGSPTTISGREISDSYVSEERTPKYNKNSTTYHIVHNSNNSIILRTSNLLSDEPSRKNNLYNGNYNDLSVNVNGGSGSDMDKAQNELTSTAASSGNSSYLESSSSNNSGMVNSKANKIAGSQKKRSYDSDSSENSSTNGGCTLRSNKKLKKKARRSSVLSIDLNEEDTQIADESDDTDATMPFQATTAASSNQRIMTRRKSARNHQNGDH